MTRYSVDSRGMPSDKDCDAKTSAAKGTSRLRPGTYSRPTGTWTRRSLREEIRTTMKPEAGD